MEVLPPSGTSMEVVDSPSQGPKLQSGSINSDQTKNNRVLAGEYFILEKDGIPVAGIMGAEELEDYLKARDPAIRAQIEKSNADIVAGRTRPAGKLLNELRAARAGKSKRSAFSRTVPTTERAGAP